MLFFRRFSLRRLAPRFVAPVAAITLLGTVSLLAAAPRTAWAQDFEVGADLIINPIGEVRFGTEVIVTGTLNGETFNGDTTRIKVSVDDQPVSNPFEALLAPGTHTVTVTVPGDSLYAPTSRTIPFTVTGTPGKITGGGSVGSGVRNLGFVVQARSRAGALSFTGSVEFQDKAAGLNLHSTTITGLAVDPGGVLGVFAGTANVNGAPGFTFVAWVEDKAEPGAGVDTFRIQIFKNGFFYESAATAAAPSVLDKGGNIQVHKTN